MESPTTQPAVDFDYTGDEYDQNWIEIYANLRQTCPVAHSSAHGGFHVLTRLEFTVVLEEVLRRIPDCVVDVDGSHPLPQHRHRQRLDQHAHDLHPGAREGSDFTP